MKRSKSNTRTLQNENPDIEDKIQKITSSIIKTLGSSQATIDILENAVAKYKSALTSAGMFKKVDSVETAWRKQNLPQALGRSANGHMIAPILDKRLGEGSKLLRSESIRRNK